MKWKVGMSQDIGSRKGDHERTHGALHNWNRYGPYNTKSEARRAEIRQAQIRGIHPGPEGGGPQHGTYYVYEFQHH